MENSGYTERDQIMIAEGALSVVVHLKLIIERTPKSNRLSMIESLIDRFLSATPEEEVNDMKRAIAEKIGKQLALE